MASDPTATPDDQPSVAEPNPSVETNPSAAEGVTPAPSASPPDGEKPSSARIKIGSQRDAAEKHQVKPVGQLAPANPAGQEKETEQASAEEKEPQFAPPPKKPKELVKTPSRNEVDDELEAMLGGISVDSLIGKEAVRGVGVEIPPDTVRRATVVRVSAEDVFFALSAQHEGVCTARSFVEPPKIGTPMDVVVRSFKEAEGLYEVSIPGAAVDVSDWEDITEGAVIEARITGANTGGLECQVNSIRGFIPASQIAVHRVENFGDYVGQKLECVVTECNPKKRNLVLSHRAVLEREQEKERAAMLEKIQPGQEMEGTVRSLRDFGAFVELAPGVDGLIHISKLSWERVKHPSEVLSEGQKVKVKIEKVDQQTGKIGLSYRELTENPWARVTEKYPLGAIVGGTVSRVAKFGAFVKLEPGVEGLIHISELAHHRVIQVTNVVKEGNEVEVKIVSVDPDAQRIGLSLKATQEPPKTEKKEKEEEAEEPLRQPVIKRTSQQPLKGGVDGSSGGGKFGLKW